MGENRGLKIGTAFVLGMLILGVYAWIGDNDTMYLVNEYIAYDDSLFPNNLLREGNAVSSKYLSDMLSGILFHVLNWNRIRILCYIAAISILCLAFINFSLRWKMNNVIVSTVVMAILSLQEVTGNLAIYSTNVGGGNYERLAAAIGVLAVSFCFGNRKWNLALCLTACAAVLHIHEGMYSFSFVMLLWLVGSAYTRRWEVREIAAGLTVCLAVILVSVIPPLLTNEVIYSGKEYIDNFIWKRLANHIMPFKWGNFAICRQYMIFGTILCFSFVFLKSKTKSIPKVYYAYAMAAVVTASAVILLSSIFIDIVPVRFFANLFMAKYFKYCEFYFLVLLTFTLDFMLHTMELRFFALGIIMLIPISEWTVIVLLPSVVICFLWNSRSAVVSSKRSIYAASAFVMAICTGVVIYFYIKNNQIDISYNTANVVYWGVILLSAAGIEYLLNECRIGKKQLAALLTGVLLFNVGYFVSKISYNRPDRSLALKNSEYWIEKAATKDIYELAAYLKWNSDKDALVLADPKDFAHGCAASWFQCLALRDVYVTDKVIVYTDAGIKEWNARLEKLSGWDAFTANDFYNIMKEIGSDYLLLDEEDSQKVQDCALFKCAADTSSYHLYQIQ